MGCIVNIPLCGYFGEIIMKIDEFDVVQFDVGSTCIGKGSWIWRPYVRIMLKKLLAPHCICLQMSNIMFALVGHNIT